MVAGLGTITPASGYVGPGGALIIGISAGIICFYCTQLIKRKFKIDDSLDVFPVHGVGGILGSLLVAVFASPDLGVFSGFSEAGYSILAQLKVQGIAVVATIAYTAVVSYALLKLTGVLTGGIRVTLEEETAGLDIVSHEESGYKL
jgi:Amt family ammonium transporter